jgi:hypothetical protein
MDVNERPHIPFFPGREAIHMLIKKAASVKNADNIPTTDRVMIVKPRL